MHPYLRAYMAGVALPTMVVPVVIAALTLQHSNGQTFRLEEVVIFPIGLVPSAWGLWNVLHVWSHRCRQIPIGLFGASLVFVLGPLAFALQLGLDKVIWTPPLVAVGLPVTIAVYYLAWKHVVGRFNDTLGIG
jgi:hypothetical protein